MKLPLIALKNAQFTVTVIVLMVLLGLVSYLTMPRSEDPQFDMPITLLEIVYPGASPADIETLVVDPIEASFAEIENIKKIESQIKNDGARIEVTFIYGVDADLSYDRIKQAVAEVKPTLPEGIQELLVLKATPKSVAIMQLALWSEPTDYKTMEFYAKQLEKRLEAIPAVRKSDIWGYPPQVVAVDLNLELLHHYGIGVNDVNNVLQGRALNITPGFVDASTRRFNVNTSGNFTDLTSLQNTIIVTNDDYVLRLKDIAQVSAADYEPAYLAYYDEKPVIFVTVEQRENTNIFDLTHAIDAEIAAFKATIPDNVQIEPLFKQAQSVEYRVNGFFDNLIQGLVLVGVMSLLFLGLREALVVVSVIPLSFMIAIGWLDLSGFGLQQMSIVGLIIALGLLVDNAIVVTESIHREMPKHSDKLTASAQGASIVGWAITSGTITTMFAFLPMLMLNSSTGDFLRSMPVTVVLVLLASLLLALTLTPLLARLTFSQKPSKIKTLQVYLNRFAEKIYAPILVVLIRFKYVVLALAMMILVGMFSVFGQVGVSLFPKAEKPMVMVDVEMPANTALSATNEVMQDVAKYIGEFDFVESVGLNVGSANPRIYYNQVPKRGVSKYGQMVVVLNDYQEQTMSQFVADLRQEFNRWHQAKITVNEFTQGPVTDKPITVRLMGENLTDLEKVAKDVEAFMIKQQGMINVDNPIGEANTIVSMGIDYEKAGLANVNIQALDMTLQTILSGAFVGWFNDDNGESYPIVVRNQSPEVESFDQVYISNMRNELLPLNQVVNVQLMQGQPEFFHYQKLRMAKVSADADLGYSINELTLQVVDYLDNYDLPIGISYNLGGEEESRQENFAGLSQILLITAIGIFAILVLQFKSILQPMIIFTSIPFAIAGSAIGLFITGSSFSMMAFIGLISLFGIVVNNAIILIDTANRNLLSETNKVTAITQASATRFTPILLTTLTTIGGLLPLTLFGGSLWQPLGIVIISGLCVSALSSFFLVPVLTELFTKAKQLDE
ncbi:efflux RND transporter permease subunit [Thalassotalea sp. LPB0316]|uniref:efflux RND transporter permease subunit n=1 Tax=Thalassotalea sp. LPB0316 TaxID=2769490 RepID=UPI001865AD35|nr:efflux RND transporter permease subunit [Thalassotalea sp. LPB0316]QOL26484.1 efflux RND transporter permease subunit [Thalassotalea sp. LPB0316]